MAENGAVTFLFLADLYKANKVFDVFAFIVLRN